MTTMAIDHQQRFGGGLNFDHMPYPNTPQFTNPWTTSGPQSHSLYASSQIDLKQQQQQQQQPQQAPPRMHASVGSYTSVPLPASSSDLLPNRPIPSGYGGEAAYSSAPSPVHSNYPPVSTPYDSMGYAPAPVRSSYSIPAQQQQHENARRLSQPGLPTEMSRSFGDAIDASRGMIAMSQNATPRNIYGGAAPGRARGSGDSYGFPATHSTSSSISSSGTYPSYFGGSVDSSVSDYSNTGSDIESVSSRTLPRPSGLLSGGIPPAPQSMMGQFSSKISSSAQKKHKCKVCDKRFTRPSSLQTHMYSHTGEKPFSCEVEGCGRHFSVVSNLRRHKKVHKGGEARSEAGSEDRQSDE